MTGPQKDFLDEDNYKSALRTQLSFLRTQGSSLTWKKASALVPMQYTYLSRVLNRDEQHFSEDHLHALCRILEFLPSERDFLMLLRARDSSQDKTRKAELDAQVERLRREKKLQSKDVRVEDSLSLTRQADYLLDPVCVLVHVSMHIEKFKKDPRLLSEHLGVDVERIKSCLQKLARIGFIELDDIRWKVKSISSEPIHFGREHPLMRVHQQLQRALMQERLKETADSHKISNVFTFTLDEGAFEDIKKEYQSFLKRVESIARRARDANLYQISFDFFRWF